MYIPVLLFPCYVVVTSAAQNLATAFHQRNQIGIIPFANVALGFIVRSTNAFLLERVPHWIRVIVFGLMTLLGLSGVALSILVDFWFAIAAIVVLGGASAFGESAMLGYMKKYPSELVDGWSSGTGMAGVAGSALYALLSDVAELQNYQIFLLLCPSVLIYWSSFALLRPPSSLSSSSSSASPPPPDGSVVRSPSDTEEQSEDPSSSEKDEEQESLLHKDYQTIRRGEGYTGGDAETDLRAQEDENDSFDIKEEKVLHRYWRCLQLCWWPTLQLTLVYFLEYVVSTGCADRANPSCPNHAHPSCPWVTRNAYTILSFCYQAGVLISRSSLRFVKIRRIGWLTLIQAMNFVLWMFQARFHFLNVWIQFVCMVFVGLLGGASYVNVFYILLHDERLSKRDQELCINMPAIGITVGISAASLFILLMDHTFLPESSDSS